MPRFRVQRCGTVFFCIAPGIPEQAFLDRNGNHRRNQSKQSWDLRGFSADDILYRTDADSPAHNSQDSGQKQGGHALITFMPVWMLLIRFFGGNLHAKQHNQSAENIGGGVYRVADHCA